MNLVHLFSKLKESLQIRKKREGDENYSRIFDVSLWLSELKDIALDETLKEEFMQDIPYLIDEALEQNEHPLHDYFRGYELREYEIEGLFQLYSELSQGERQIVRQWLEIDCCLTLKELRQEHSNQVVEDCLFELEEVPCQLYVDVEEMMDLCL